MSSRVYVVPLREVDLEEVSLVGGKNAQLGALLRHLGVAGVRVPDGFAITADAYRRHVQEAGLAQDIDAELARIDVDDVAALAPTARAIRDRVRAAPLPADITRELCEAYGALDTDGGLATDVAVRSSGLAEDGGDASFAGQHDTFLNVRGAEAVIEAVKACMASLFTDRAIVYRHRHGVSRRGSAMAVCVQKMVRSDLASAGVMFTLDPQTGFRDVVEIASVWGLGELLVQGKVDADALTIHKPTLLRGFRPIVRRSLADKPWKLVYADRPDELDSTHEVAVASADRRRASLGDDDALTLARWAVAIEDHHARRGGFVIPLDLEWAKDGRTGQLFIVQVRPETVHARRALPAYERFERTGRGEVVLTGRSVGTTVGHGRVRVIGDPSELIAFRNGEVLVAEQLSPDWEPAIARAAAVISDRGSTTAHAAISARELGVPCVVGAERASRVLHTGDEVTVSCADGELGRVYRGQVEYARRVIDPSTLPIPPVSVTLVLGDPSSAFLQARLPCAGVGLARLELMMSYFGVHPMALLHPERIRDAATRAELAARTARVTWPPELFVAALAIGIAELGAAFYPRPVIVRFSDFRSSGYAGLLGGKDLERVDEPNPLLGLRGVARYCHPHYREAFALECEAIRRVREGMGLNNVHVMIPFCRTLDEARRILGELTANGLRRETGLQVHLLCQVPNNLVLAAEFAELFDGFSVASSELSQLVLGVDREANVLAEGFDERDRGVRKLIALLVAAAHRRGRSVSFYGQGPADDPDDAVALASLGIDSLAVTPEAFARVVDRLVRASRAPTRRPPAATVHR